MSRYPRKPSGPKLPLAEAPDFLSVPEVAAVLGVSKGMAYEMIREGRIYSFRLGRRLFIPKAAMTQLGEVPQSQEKRYPQ